MEKKYKKKYSWKYPVDENGREYHSDQWSGRSLNFKGVSDITIPMGTDLWNAKNLTAKQIDWNSAFGNTRFPKGMDMKGISLKNASFILHNDLSGMVNFTWKQLFSIEEITGEIVLPEMDMKGVPWDKWWSVRGFDFSRVKNLSYKVTKKEGADRAIFPEEFDFEGVSFTKENLSGKDFSKAKNLTAKQLFKPSNNLQNIKLPDGMDFNGISFKGIDISGIDFSKAKNLTLKQRFESDKSQNTIFPPLNDFKGVSLKNKVIRWDFSTAVNLKVKQLFEASGIINSILPDMDLKGVSLKEKSIQGTDFSKVKNFTPTQLLEASNITGVKLPDGMDFKGVSLEGINISGIDFSNVKNLTPAQLLEASNITDVKLSDGMDFKGVSLEGINISGIDFSKAKNLSVKQIEHAINKDNAVLPTQLNYYDSNESSEVFWRKNSSKGLSAVVGFSPDKKDFSIEIGVNDKLAHNALLGGGVGSGKTTLLHTFILGLAKDYSPDELRLALLDYKEGTEFTVYKNLPHVFALSLGSKVKFGRDVLMTVLKEKEMRGMLFREVGVNNIEAYRTKTGKKLPRILVIIDEFQKLFNDRHYGDDAKTFAEDIIRTGRSFGINMVLSSQSLSDGALQRSIIENIPLRICLRLSEGESTNFLTVKNDAPTKFKEVGDALANYQMGEEDSNLYFKAIRLSEEYSLDLISNLKQKFDTGNYEKFEKYIYANNDPIPLLEARKYAREHEIVLALSVGIPSIAEKYTTKRRARVYVCASDLTADTLLLDYINVLKEQYKLLGKEIEDAEIDDFDFGKANPDVTYFINMDNTDEYMLDDFKLGLGSKNTDEYMLDDFKLGLGSKISFVFYGSDPMMLKKMYRESDVKICLDKITANIANLFIQDLDNNNIIINRNNLDYCTTGLILTTKK